MAENRSIGLAPDLFKRLHGERQQPLPGGLEFVHGAPAAGEQAIGTVESRLLEILRTREQFSQAFAGGRGQFAPAMRKTFP